MQLIMTAKSFVSALSLPRIPRAENLFEVAPTIVGNGFGLGVVVANLAVVAFSETPLGRLLLSIQLLIYLVDVTIADSKMPFRDSVSFGSTGKVFIGIDGPSRLASTFRVSTSQTELEAANPLTERTSPIGPIIRRGSRLPSWLAANRRGSRDASDKIGLTAEDGERTDGWTAKDDDTHLESNLRPVIPKSRTDLSMALDSYYTPSAPHSAFDLPHIPLSCVDQISLDPPLPPVPPLKISGHGRQGSNASEAPTIKASVAPKLSLRKSLGTFDPVSGNRLSSPVDVTFSQYRMLPKYLGQYEPMMKVSPGTAVDPMILKSVPAAYFQKESPPSASDRSPYTNTVSNTSSNSQRSKLPTRASDHRSLRSMSNMSDFSLSHFPKPPEEDNRSSVMSMFDSSSPPKEASLKIDAETFGSSHNSMPVTIDTRTDTGIIDDALFNFDPPKMPAAYPTSPHSISSIGTTASEIEIPAGASRNITSFIAPRRDLRLTHRSLEYTESGYTSITSSCAPNSPENI